MTKPGAVSLVLLLAWAGALGAQDWAKPGLSSPPRLDLRDLGYPMVNEVPVNSSVITSLVAHRDGRIYGATSGDEAYLLVFDPAINKVRHLGKIPGQQAVHHALVSGAEALYLGTGLSMLQPLELTPGTPGGDQIDELLWKDIRARFQADAGGHLYCYRPEQNLGRVKLPQMACELEDLGIPVPHNAVYALAIHGPQLYGLSYPDGHFFVYDLDARRVNDLGPVDKERVFHGPERDWRSLPRALLYVPDNSGGSVLTSGTGGRLIRYRCTAQKLETTPVEIPGDYNHVQFYKDHAVIECLVQHPSGLVYGGTCDGYLFSLDPVKMKLVNLGKPRAARRLRCLTVGHDGKVYLMAGERVASRPCQFYCFDPRQGGFEDLGLLVVDRSPYYYWRGYQFDAMATGQDGTIYLGESERKSHLFLFFP